MLNHIDLMGRLTKDPDLRTTQSGTPVASFTIACERDFGEKTTDFVDIVAWKATGEFVSKYFKKGSMIAISGRLQSRKWETREGQKVTSWEVNAEHVYFGESKIGESKKSDGYAQIDGGYTAGYEEIQDDGELPF